MTNSATVNSGECTVLKPKHILFLDSTTKEAALKKLIACLEDSDVIGDTQEFEKGIFRREELMSTGIGYGIAVPHVRLASVKSPVMSVGICQTPLTGYKSMDDVPISLIFMIVAGVNQQEEYLGLLSKISTMVRDGSSREAIANTDNSEKVCKIINNYIGQQ